MKKIVALLMTAVMTIGMTTAAFAAPSPQPTTGTIVAGKNASGQDVDLSKVKTSDNYSTNDAPGVEKIKANPQSVLKDAGVMAHVGFDLIEDTIKIMEDGNAERVERDQYHHYEKPYIFLRDVDVEPIILDSEKIFDDPKIRF